MKISKEFGKFLNKIHLVKPLLRKDIYKYKNLKQNLILQKKY